jgi:hypothetical protein
VDVDIDEHALGLGWEALRDAGLVPPALGEAAPEERVRSASQIKNALHHLRTMWKLLDPSKAPVEEYLELLRACIGRLTLRAAPGGVDVAMYADCVQEVPTGAGEAEWERCDEGAPNAVPRCAPAFYADMWIIMGAMEAQRRVAMVGLGQIPERRVWRAPGEEVSGALRARLRAAAEELGPDAVWDEGALQAMVAAWVEATLARCERDWEAAPSSAAANALVDEAQAVADLDHELEAWAPSAAYARHMARGREAIVRRGLLGRAEEMPALGLVPSAPELVQWAVRYVRRTSSVDVLRSVYSVYERVELMPGDAALHACYDAGGDARPGGVLRWRSGPAVGNKIAERVNRGPADILADCEGEHVDASPVSAACLIRTIAHAHRNVCGSALSLDEACVVWMDMLEGMDELALATAAVPILVQMHGAWAVALSGARTAYGLYSSAILVWLKACALLEDAGTAMFPIRVVLVAMCREIAREDRRAAKR